MGAGVSLDGSLGKRSRISFGTKVSSDGSGLVSNFGSDDGPFIPEPGPGPDPGNILEFS